jgi:hypothetical protein
MITSNGCITRFLRPARVTRGFQAPQEQIYSQEGQSRKKRVMLPIKLVLDMKMGVLGL